MSSYPSRKVLLETLRLWLRLPWWESTVIYGRDQNHSTPYLQTWSHGKLHVHRFFRGDADPDPHDHKWDYWTFPLVGYVEEVCVPHEMCGGLWEFENVEVPAFQLHYRRAEHCHRVMGPLQGTGSIWTVVWTGPVRRDWGFQVGSTWVPWRTYVFGQRPDLWSKSTVLTPTHEVSP